MPAAKSGKQYRFLQGIANGNLPALGNMDKNQAKVSAMSTGKGLRSKWAKKKNTNAKLKY